MCYRSDARYRDHTRTERERERENIHLFSCTEKRKNLSFLFLFPFFEEESLEKSAASRRSLRAAQSSFKHFREIHTHARVWNTDLFAGSGYTKFTRTSCRVRFLHAFVCRENSSEQNSAVQNSTYDSCN